MLKNCLNCDRPIYDDEMQFCSWQCDKNYKEILVKLENIIKNSKEPADIFAEDN